MNDWLHKDKPLWMPEGSVRAILAIGFVLGLLVYVFVGVFYNVDKDRFHMGLAVLEGLAGMAFGYYFGARQSASGGNGVGSKE